MILDTVVERPADIEMLPVKLKYITTPELCFILQSYIKLKLINQTSDQYLLDQTKATWSTLPLAILYVFVRVASRSACRIPSLTYDTGSEVYTHYLPSLKERTR